MWKYLKDYVIGKLLEKWIIPSDNQNNQEALGQHLFCYRNSNLNVKSFNEEYLQHFDYEIEFGTVEELSVSINWMEIFRYWTEIKIKYHIEDDENDFNFGDDTVGGTDCSDCSKVKIKNLNLKLKSTTKKKEFQDDFEEDMWAVDVDLMKDFLDHVLSQFKVEIEGITIELDNGTIIKIPYLFIAQEVLGLRRGSLQSEDLIVEYKSTKLTVSKGTELLLARSIEGFKIKVNIPGIIIKMDEKLDFGFMNYKKSSSNPSSYFSFEISLEMIRIVMGPFELIANDLWLDSCKEFIVGHFESKWKDKLIVESPIQSHLISGNFRNGLDLLIEDEIRFRIKDFEQVSEIQEYFRKLVPSPYANNANEITKQSIKLKGLRIQLLNENIEISLQNMKIENDSLSIQSIEIVYSESLVLISNVQYDFSKNIIKETITGPFSEMKRFIENDEITSIEDYEVLYGKYKKNLTIRSIELKVHLPDIQRIITSTDGRSIAKDKTDRFLLLIGSVDQFRASVSLDESTIYTTNLINSSFLISERFIDFRSKLESLQRGPCNLIKSSGLLNFSWTRELSVIEIDDLFISLPFNIHEMAKNDMKCIMDNFTFSNGCESETSPAIQVTLKRTSVNLLPPLEIDEPIKSEIRIKEINFKTDNFVYLDDLELLLKTSKEGFEPILNSGLLKIELKEDYVTVRNHCSTATFTKEGYIKFIQFAQFWSEFYSPEIAEIDPKAVFHSEPETFFGEDNDNLSGRVVLEGEDENLEFLFELSECEEEQTDTLDCDSKLNTEDLLKDIDEEFFVVPTEDCFNQQSSSADSIIKISNFGLNINLKLENGSIISISLNGIDGNISIGGNIDFKIKESFVIDCNNNNKVLLGRWLRGPDLTCRYPIEDGNFFSLKASKTQREVTSPVGIDEFNLKISTCPLRLFLDQELLNSITAFFKPIDIKPRDSSNVLRSFVFFNKVTISPLALKLDYNTNPSIPLQGAEMILPKIELRGVKGFEGLCPAILSAWIPELRGKRLTSALTTGLVPVRTVINLGGGVVELILLPWQLGMSKLDSTESNYQSQSAAHAVAQFRKSSKKIGLETLKLTTSLANTTSKLLNTSSSMPASAYPRDFQSGLQQAAQLIVALPTRINQQNQKKGAFRALPLLILDSAAVATGALAKTLQGIQAEFDRELDRERALKHSRR